MRSRKTTKSGEKPALADTSVDVNYNLSDQDDEFVDSIGVASPSVGSEAVSEEKEKPKSRTFMSIFIRTLTASVLALFFIGLMQAGHFYCILLGGMTQTEIFRELVNVRYVEAKARQMPAFRTLQWSWFCVAMLFVYGDTLNIYFSEHSGLNYLTLLTKHVNVVAFVLYIIVFGASVLTLKPSLLRYQLSQYMWSIAIICLVVFQCKFFARNTLNGLFWFFFPMATVSMNDVAAYFCGISLGKKFIQAPFLALSPSKTWEGFIGAWVITMIFSFYFPAFLSQWTWFTCPAEEIHLNLFPPPLHCVPNKIFTDSFDVNIPLMNFTMSVLPIQIHGLAYGLFASLVAPFGGFLASAIKRAYNLKDFDSFMPGHGGMMDRMDCQLVMMAFTSFHFFYFVSPSPTLARVKFLASSLNEENQLLLLHYLTELIQANKNNAPL